MDPQKETKMGAPDQSPRRYKWPWFVLGAVVLGIVLAVIWVGAAVRKIEREKDVNAPLPSSAPAR